jgi:hypothetical protein
MVLTRTVNKKIPEQTVPTNVIEEVYCDFCGFKQKPDAVFFRVTVDRVTVLPNGELYVMADGSADTLTKCLDCHAADIVKYPTYKKLVGAL